MKPNLTIDYEHLISKNLLSVAVNSIIAVDLQGMVTFWNNGAERIFGYKREEILNKSLKIIYPDFDENLLLVDLERTKEGGSYVSEWEGRNKSGETVWVDLNTNILKDDNDNIIGFIGLSKDITTNRELHFYKSELSSIVQYSADGMESVDLEGNVLSWNKSAEKIYGYSSKEIIGKKSSILYVESNIDEFQRVLKIIIQGKVLKNFETKRRKKDGSIIDVSITFSPQINNEEEISGISVITRDITDQKLTLKKLNESEIKYQTIFENSGEGFFLMTERFIDVNKKACELFESSKEEIIGKSPLDFSPEKQSDGVSSEIKAKEYIKKAFEEGNVSFYWQHISKSKDTINTRITLNRIVVKDKNYLIAIMHNMTEVIKYQNKLKVKTKSVVDKNKKMHQLNNDLNETNNQLKIINQQIEQSEKKFRVAFKTSPDAININRISDGLYIDINDGFTNLMGYTERDVRGKTSIELNVWVNPKDRNRLVNALLENEFVSNLEAQFRRKDGSVTTALMSASFIEVNKEKYILSITRDISERKESEEKLKKAMEKAEESDLLKSAFLANMSHEIRTPMNAILGFSQLLKEKRIEPEKQDKFLDIIVSRSKNLLQIINDIIDISKIEANQLTIENNEFSLKKSLYELYSFFEAEIYTHNKSHVNLTLSADLSEVIGNIRSDEVRLKQILTNLISNAIKFTEKGEIEFGYNVKGDNLEFFVRDTGIGIPEESKKHIFERFRQADDSSTREFGGTGLGLSICKQLVEKLGGEIWFDSKTDKGSIFYFTIPLEMVTQDQSSSELNASNFDLTGKTILIVEDDLISMTYLEELLIGTKASILKAFNGEKAVEIFKNNANIDIVLMDVYLPKMSGNDATREIKKINAEIPVVMQSAYALPSDKKESFKYGCDDYITKPIDPRLLMVTIKKFMQ
ncbi:MAG: PAS domain S-box protein [Bacteroidales bacterium]|nr:PAS domain S-box protein [Bacteroidales bacterium]